MFGSPVFRTRGCGLNVGEDKKVCGSGESMSAYKAIGRRRENKDYVESGDYELADNRGVLAILGAETRD